MTIDLKMWEKETVRDLTVNHGMSPDLAIQIHIVCSDALMRTQGGASHYIPAKRRTDKKAIRAAHAAGWRIETLARNTGLSQERIRQIIKE